MTSDYHQATGEFTISDRNGAIVFAAVGYAGRGAGLNNPQAEHVKGEGPLPTGCYRVGSPVVHQRLGPLAFPLTRLGGDPYGRSGFFVHGDNRHRNNTASSGCIVLDRAAREAIRDHKVMLLRVHLDDA